MSINRNAAIRGDWMQEFSRIVIGRVPSQAGRIDWPTASYLYSKGIGAREAAECYTAPLLNHRRVADLVADIKREADADALCRPSERSTREPYAWGENHRAGL